MRRPAWAAASGFARCWAATEAMASPPVFKDYVLRCLQEARVVSIGADQAAVLPPPGDGSYASSGMAMRSVRAPFTVTFLDTDGVSMEPRIKEGRLFGALVIDRPPDAIAEQVAAAYGGHPDELGGLRVIPFIGERGREPMPFGEATSIGRWDPEMNSTEDMPAGYDGPAIGLRLLHDLFTEASRRLGEDHPAITQPKECLADGAVVVTSVLSWLESVNVDLAEAPLSAKQRARELQKGRQIALTVRVRQPKRRPARPSSGGKADYSHRFEVRGHYMHFAKGPIFDATPPEKRSFVPGIGECRKVWCPPHVKGPSDKPLIPKIRTIENEQPIGGGA